ncbi:2526_t:CDS:2, partial [Cetraspora pellucida]
NNNAIVISDDEEEVIDYPYECLSVGFTEEEQLHSLCRDVDNAQSRGEEARAASLLEARGRVGLRISRLRRFCRSRGYSLE